jgi:hypothetical protein
MSLYNHDDDRNPFSPAGDLEDDSLLDEVLMDSYEDEDDIIKEDAKEAAPELEDEKDLEDIDELDEDEAELPEDTAGR